MRPKNSTSKNRAIPLAAFRRQSRKCSVSQKQKSTSAKPSISGQRRLPRNIETVNEIATKRKRTSFVAVPHELSLKYRDPRVQAAVDFMNVNYHRNIKLDGLARAVSISNSQVSRIFKAETGFSPIDYLIRLRLEKGRDLLKTSFLSIKQVMAAVGYNNKGTSRAISEGDSVLVRLDTKRACLSLSRHLPFDGLVSQLYYYPREGTRCGEVSTLAGSRIVLPLFFRIRP